MAEGISRRRSLENPPFVPAHVVTIAYDRQWRALGTLGGFRGSHHEDGTRLIKRRELRRDKNGKEGEKQKLLYQKAETSMGENQCWPPAALCFGRAILVLMMTSNQRGWT